MPHTDPDHGLRVQLATALRERDDARALAVAAHAVAAAAESDRDALRADVKRLREILDECVRIIDKMASNGARGRTWEIAQEVLLKARAALATGGDRG